jgi:hypothetical protein
MTFYIVALYRNLQIRAVGYQAKHRFPEPCFQETTDLLLIFRIDSKALADHLYPG